MTIFYLMSHLLATHAFCIPEMLLFILIFQDIFFLVFFIFLLLMLLFLAAWLLFTFLATAPPNVLRVKVFTSMCPAAPLEVLVLLKVFRTKLTCLEPLIDFTFSTFESFDSLNEFINFFSHLRYLFC